MTLMLMQVMICCDQEDDGMMRDGTRARLLFSADAATHSDDRRQSVCLSVYVCEQQLCRNSDAALMLGCDESAGC